MNDNGAAFRDERWNRVYGGLLPYQMSEAQFAAYTEWLRIPSNAEKLREILK